MSPQSTQQTGSIRLNLVDGTRRDIPVGPDLLIRVLDGKKQMVRTFWWKGPAVPILGLPFHDSPDDWYTVIVHGSGYEDAGIYPIRLRAGHTVDAYAMLMAKNGQFHFSPFDSYKPEDALSKLIANGATGDVKTRFYTAVENQPTNLGALLTIGTAVRDIPMVDGGSPLDCYWEVMWDLLAPDRFWAWVDTGLADRVKQLADLNSFAEEADAAHWHPGVQNRVGPATRSWKQTRFDVTNVQLTFHENDKRTITTANGPVNCVVVEPDIDYYKDVLAHGLIEVIPNLLTGGKTDPRMVYSMRWTATEIEGITPEFEPPVTIE